jgi:hypothetical protein
MSGTLSLVYPVMAQVLLTLVIGLRLGTARVSTARAGKVSMRDVAMSDDAWPDDIRRIGNNLRNQFEMPVLFYVLCGVATYIGATGVLMTLLAWGYFATRVVHSAIHVTYNRVQHRVLPFAIGICILFAMWVVVAVRLLA